MRGEPSEFTPHPPAYPEPVEGAPSPTRGEGSLQSPLPRPSVSEGRWERVRERGYLQQWTLPTPLQKLLHQHYPTHDFNTLLLALWIVYLYRLGNQPKVGVLLQLPDQNLELPYFTALQNGLHFGQVVTQLQAELLAMQQKGSYLPDIFYRYPNLTEVKETVFTAVVMREIEQLQKSRAALVLVISAKDSSLSWYVDQNCVAQELYLKTILQQMPGHLETLLTAITTQPETPIADLVLLTPQEQQQILIDWNQTETDYPRDKTIPQLFEEQVQKHPNKIAVCFENQSLTYRELNQQANQLAHYLSQQGVVAETLVAICMERSIEMIIGILGILKAGGVYVPIDPEYPRARIKFIFEDCRALFVLTQSRLAKKIHTITDGAIITVDKIKNIKIRNKEFISLNFDSSQLAYVIYTSGTTGKPKGVLIKHQAVVNTVLAKLRKFAINHSDRILNFSTLSFDASVWEIFPCLFAGATLYLARKENLLPGSKLTHFLEKNKITITTLVPSILAITPPPSTSHLRIIISAGESCSRAIVKQWVNVPLFVNAYGPTEITICATMATLGASISKITIGKPIANTKIFILDDNMQPLPMGITGELYVTGHGLAKGYLNRDALTNSKFIPWSLEHGTKEVSQIVYKTGDLARWLPDGNLEYMGRMDEQIKILGCRVELSELEQIAVAYPNILQAVACLDTTAEKSQIKLFFIKKNNCNKIDIAKFSHFLKKQLARYSVPSKIIEVARFPRTVNGKIDKNLLLKKPSLINEQAVQGPMSAKETLLLEIFQKILGVDSLSVEDDFFFLGGDSILAMHLVSKINALGLQCSVRDVFEASTIKKLVKRLHEKTATKPTAPLAQNFALTPIQRWFFEQSFTHPQQFVQICWLEFQKSVDLELLLCCLREVIEWHEIFRLQFKKEQGNWQQYYADKVHDLCTDFPVIDSRLVPIQDFVNEWAMNVAQNFNFETGYLLKVALVRQQGQITHLLLVAHHLIMDGVSWQIFLDELQSLYAGLKEGGTNWQKFANSTSYQQWVYALENYVVSSQFKEEQGYWQGVDSFTPIPIDHQQGTNIEKSAEYVTVTLAVEETQSLLRTFSKTHHLNTDEILIALLAKSLMRWCQTDCITLDIERHGREELTTEINLSATLGWFTSVFPLRLSCNKNLSLLEIIQSVQQQLQAVPRHGISYGLRRFVKTTDCTADQQSQIAFNYWGQLDQAFAQNFFSIGELKLLSHPKNIRPYLITIDAVIKNKQLELSWTYSRNFHRRTTIAKLAQRFLADLKNLLQMIQPEQSLSCIREQVHKLANSFPQRYPLTPLQKGLLYHALSTPNASAYVVQFYWTLDASINLSILQQSFEYLISRHDILRTRFVWKQGGEPLQVAEPKGNLHWHQYHWERVSRKEQQTALQEFLLADREAGFALDEVSLLRVTWIHLRPGQGILVITTHHILLDGWSFSLFMQELDSIYHRFQQQQTLKLTPALPFSSYVHWLQLQPKERARQFWSQYLSGIEHQESYQNFLLKEKNASSLIHQTADHVLKLPVQLTQEIHNFLKVHHLTANTFFQALWALLLHRYTQTDDVIFGISFSLRPSDIQGDRILGLMVNTLPLRIRFANEHTALNYLKHVQRNILEVLEYGYVFLSEIQTWNPASRNLQDLLQSLLVVENYPKARISALKINFHDITIVDSTHYPLTISVFQQEETQIKFSYDVSKVESAKLKQVIAHYAGLMTTLLQNPEQLIHRLPLLSTQEYQQILYDWNPHQASRDSAQTIHALFAQQAKKHPHRIAVVFEQKQLTYRELENQANRLACALQQAGVKSGTLLALYLERGISMLVAILASLKAGAHYLPIDPQNPPKRIEYLIKDSQATCLLTEKKTLSSKSLNLQSSVRVVYLEDCRFVGKNSFSLPRVSVDDLAYVMYTSGSTGDPKGTLITHRNVTQLMVATQSLFHFTDQDTWSLFHSFHFDFSVWEMWGALLNGGKLEIVPASMQQDLSNFYRWMVERSITVLNVTPSVFYQLMTIDQMQPQSLLLRYVIFGGEALSISALSPWFARHDYRQPQLINMYGITEATIHATYHVLTEENVKTSEYSIIGKPLPERAIYLLDKNQLPVPPYVIGEIYVGGSGVAKGYLNKLQLTQDKFVANPFIDHPSEPLYRSGDLAMWLPDGTLAYKGRSDDQVKIRGFRIELGEIEARILDFQGVKQALVTTHSNPAGDLVFNGLYDVQSSHHGESIASLFSGLFTVLYDPRGLCVFS